MGKPFQLFHLAQHDPIIGYHVDSWKNGHVSFEKMLSQLIVALQKECNDLFDTHDLKNPKLESSPVILEKDLVPNSLGKSELAQQSDLIDAVLYVAKIKHEINVLLSKHTK